VTSVIKPWAETEGRREMVGMRGRKKRGIMTVSDEMRRMSGVDTIEDSEVHPSYVERARQRTHPR
jgi:hypothetical protein